ncbi:glycoside hydrolase family 3 protein [Aquincola agrisoli]
MRATACVAMLVLSPVAFGQAVPTLQAKFVPEAINMRSLEGVVNVALTAAAGDLAACALANVRMGPAAPVSVAPSADRRTYVASFKKSDLEWVLPGFTETEALVTGQLSCNGGEAQGVVARGKVRVIKPTVVQSRVKPLLTVGGQKFKDLNNNGQLDRYEDWRLPVDQRVADLLSRMSLQEKAGLMGIPTSYSESQNQTYLDRNIRYLILRESNFQGKDLATRLNATQERAEASRLGIPVVIISNPLNHLSGGNAVFEPGGGAGSFSIWPGTLGMAATHNPQLIKDFASIARQEWRSVGIRRIYGYQVELATEPRWTRNRTTFGEGVELNSMIARNLVLGTQGQAIGSDSIAQVIKHFPGDGAVLRGLDPHNVPGQYAVYPTAGSLFTYQLPPFKAAIDAGASAIMSYYNRPNNALSAPQLPSEWWQSPTQQFEDVAGVYNHTLITKLLRDHLGFKGVLNSDTGVLTAQAFGVENLTAPQRWAKAVKAGADIISGSSSPNDLITAVNDGLLSEVELNKPVGNLLTEIFTLGLFENPYTNPDAAQAIAKTPANQLVADQAHRQSLVLMRNDRQLLPLKGTTNLYVEVFTAGTAAATQTAALKALLANDPNIKVVDDPAQANAALLWAQPQFETLADRVNIELGTATGVNVERIQQIQAAVPSILALNLTTGWVINSVEPGAAAVIGTYDVKAEALLDLIRGRFQPSGKLVMGIPANQAAVDANAGDVPSYAESYDYAYRNAVNDRYTFGFGKTGF